MLKTMTVRRMRPSSPELWLGLSGLGLAAAILILGLLFDRSNVENGSQASGVPQDVSPQAHASGPGNYARATGPYPVRQIDTELYDAARDKYIPLRVYYPVAPVSSSLEPESVSTASAFPVIIFSHGAGGSRAVAPALLSFWASHGYVVFAPTHDDSLALARERGEFVTMAQVIRSFGTDPQFRIRRVEDIRFITDSLADLPAILPELAGRLDPRHIGVGGHSAGALTAVLIGGAIMDMPVNGAGGPEVEGLEDERVAATLLLSGQGISRGRNDSQQGAIKEDSWLHCLRPMMVMTGSLDSSVNTGQTAESRKDPYTFAPAGDKYLLFIEGATHSSFTGKAAGLEGKGRGSVLDQLLGRQARPTDSDQQDQRAIFGLVQSNSLAFWDAYLKSEGGAKAFLQSGAPAAASADQLEYEWK